MVRDPGLEEQMRLDLDEIGHLLAERPMFGGLCFKLNGHMLCAAREGRAMYRVGKADEALALALPGVTPMVHGGRPKGGFVWLDADHLEDDDIRARLTSLAVTNVRALAAKE